MWVCMCFLLPLSELFLRLFPIGLWEVTLISVDQNQVSKLPFTAWDFNGKSEKYFPHQREQGPLRCQRENSWREYCVTQEAWRSLLWLWQPQVVSLAYSFHACGPPGPLAQCQSDIRLQWRVFFIWSDPSNNTLLLPQACDNQ